MAMGRAWGRLPFGWRAASLGVSAAVLLNGCAHGPDWLTGHKDTAQQPTTAVAAPAPPPPAPHRARPKPAAHRPEAPPPVQVASIDPATLVGLKPVAVARVLGTPERIAKDEMSLVWTYAADDCMLQVYFYPDLNTTDFHVLKYSLAGGDGKPLPAADPCLREILSMKIDDPH